MSCYSRPWLKHINHSKGLPWSGGETVFGGKGRTSMHPSCDQKLATVQGKWRAQLVRLAESGSAASRPGVNQNKEKDKRRLFMRVNHVRRAEGSTSSSRLIHHPRKQPADSSNRGPENRAGSTPNPLLFSKSGRKRSR